MTTNPFREKGGCLTIVVALFVGVLVCGSLQAWAAMLNWNWFATTLGAPRIGFLQAYGISFVVSSLHGGDSKKDEREITDMMIDGLSTAIARFVLFAGLGWAVHAWMVN